MKLIRKHQFWAAAMLSLITVRPPVAQADSLVTTEGELLIGEVRKTDTGYTVQTKDSLITVNARDVRTILLDRHPTTGQGHSISPVTSHTPPKPPDPKVVNGLLRQGQAAVAAGEFVDARNAFADALAMDPTNPQAGRGLGFTLLKLGKPEKAAHPCRLRPVDKRWIAV